LKLSVGAVVAVIACLTKGLPTTSDPEGVTGFVGTGAGTGFVGAGAGTGVVGTGAGTGVVGTGAGTGVVGTGAGTGPLLLGVTELPFLSLQAVKRIAADTAIATAFFILNL